MRIVLLMSLLSASFVQAADDYIEDRTLGLSASGISSLDIEAGSGSLEIIGVQGLDEIAVDATVVVSTGNEEKARNKIEKDLVLTLEKQGGRAILRAYFDGGLWSFGEGPSVQLTVRMPEEMQLGVDDGSGPITIENVKGDISLDDGSGSIKLTGVGGTVDIDDGSGSISVTDVGGDISIIDGSGSITVRGVSGSVVVDDGSGGIEVSDVKEDLIIEDDGSGGLDFSNIGGKVEKES